MDRVIDDEVTRGEMFDLLVKEVEWDEAVCRILADDTARPHLLYQIIDNPRKDAVKKILQYGEARNQLLCTLLEDKATTRKLIDAVLVVH
jgi:hypothetical protein